MLSELKVCWKVCGHAILTNLPLNPSITITKKNYLLVVTKLVFSDKKNVDKFEGINSVLDESPLRSIIPHAFCV